MSGDESFIYGLRVRHCINGIVLFVLSGAFDVWRMLVAPTRLGQILFGMLGAFLLYMTAMMVTHLQHRRRGDRRVVVGAKSVSAPKDFKFTSPVATVAYADVTSAKVANKKLEIAAKGGNLTIEQMMLGSDAEFAKLTTLVQQRVAAKR